MMKEQQVLETRRLTLRPLMAKDDLSVRELANGPKRVLAKLGMTQEGVMREAARRGDTFQDLVLVSLLRKEWAAQALRSGPQSQVCKIRTRRHPRPPQPRPTGWLLPYGPAPVFAS